MHSPNYDDMTIFGKIRDTALHLVIPAAVLSLSSMASLQRIMRGNMLGVLRQQYILAARAKGLPESVVIYRHALRNAFNPLVTLLGYEFAALLKRGRFDRNCLLLAGLGLFAFDRGAFQGCVFGDEQYFISRGPFDHW